MVMDSVGEQEERRSRRSGGRGRSIRYVDPDAYNTAWTGLTNHSEISKAKTSGGQSAEEEGSSSCGIRRVVSAACPLE